MLCLIKTLQGVRGGARLAAGWQHEFFLVRAV